MLWLHVPGFSKPDKETRYGDGAVLTDFSNWLVIDAFMSTGKQRIIKFLKDNGVKDPFLFDSHPHCDHGNGLLDIINDTFFTPRAFYCYDPESLRPGLRNNAGSKEVKKDIDYLYELINVAKKRKIPVVYLKDGVNIKHGDIQCKVFRRQPNRVEDDDDNGWSYVNDGSLCLYFTAIRYWTSGDGPEKIYDLVKAVDAKVAVFKIPHHGNNCPMSQANGMHSNGAVLCWYNDLEPDGIGTTDFTAYGARRCKQAGITVLDTIGDINALFYGGKGYWLHGGKVYTHACEYKGGDVLKDGDMDIVSRVLSGECGTTDARVSKLLNLRYNPMKVQDLVNKTLKERAGELNGCDVASYQSGLTPSKMSTTDFIITKMTQGTDYINPYADAQYGAANTFGKLLGAYHYAEGGDPVKEAGYFLKKVGSRIGKCILALDWEGKDNPTFGSGKDVLWCLAFLEEVYKQTGVRGFIYMSKSVTNKYDWSPVAKNYPLWGAQYASNNRTNYQSNPWTDSAKWGAWGKPAIFQYSSHGSIAGYSGNIDINRAYFSRAEWLDRAAGKREPVKEETKEEPKKETPKYSRETVVALARKYVGTKEGSAGHKAIVDAYNNWCAKNGYPRGYKVKYTDAWCATFVSAIGILCGYTQIIPVECGCPQMITLAKNMGSWVEKDGYIPTAGDVILYDWDDSGKGDDTGTPDHIGFVETISGKTMQIIEGNYKNAVGRRTMTVDGRYIRGYIVPAYSAEIAQKTPVQAQEGPQGTKVDDVHAVAWTGVVATNKDPLNIRLGPGTEYGTCSFSPLKKGTKVGVCNHKVGKWLLIKYGSKYGYAHGDYIRRAT